MKNTSHIGFWLVLVLIGFLLTPLFRSREAMNVFVANELHQTEQAMGAKLGNMAKGFADRIFQGSPLSTVAKTASAVKQGPKEQELSKTVAGPMGDLSVTVYNNYMAGLIMQSYVAAVRLSIVLFWLVFLAPLFLASIFDGFMHRKIKQVEFGSIRPATFTLAGIFVIPTMCMPAVYLVMPFSISPLAAPVWAAAAALPLSLMVSNTQPLFGK